MFKIKSSVNHTELVMYTALALLGGFHEYVSCLVSFLLILNLLYRSWKKRETVWVIEPMSIAVLSIVLFYLLSCFWAVDAGMAFIGFMKYLPLLLFLLSAYQEETWSFETTLPCFVGVLTVVSLVGMQIPVFHSFFSVAGRFAGVFQYPNTFALLLLVCELLLLKTKTFKPFHYVLFGVLIFALFYTGSRTVFLLFLLSNPVALFFRFKGNKKVILAGLAGLVLLLLAFVVLSAVSPVIRRYFRISVFESTFVGRLLYWKDALPLVIRHPFGMGFLGYSYTQQSIQTGLYTVRYIHNDFLQILLDIGWIPALVFIGAVGMAFGKKKTDPIRKIVMAVIVLHACFDFDLQFLAVFLLFLLFFMNKEGGKTITLRKKGALYGALVGTALVAVYLSIPLALSHFGKTEIADEMFPFYTENKIRLLEEESDITNANDIADEMIRQNTATYIPYSIKAKYCYSQGDFTGLIENKHKVFQKNPFEYAEYEEYCRMLINGIALYTNAGDPESAGICKEELIATKSRLTNTETKLSDLGKKIKDQPRTVLPDEILEYITEIERDRA